MALSINQSLLSLKALNSLNKASSGLEKSVKKISSGLRIGSASDDPAGLAMSEKLRTQIRGFERAFLNAQDGISMVQTAEGGLSNTQGILQRIRELAVQSANSTLTSSDRLSVQLEVKELIGQINKIAASTQFNTKNLLNGSQSALVSLSSNFASAVVSANANASGSYDVSLKTLKGGVSEVQRSQILKERSSEKPVSGTTKLEDIAQLYDADGQFLLGAGETLTITGNGKDTVIQLDRQHTLNDLAAAIQQGLSSGLGIEGSYASVVSDANQGVSYIEVASGFAGDKGSFSIIGSEALTTALGFSTVRNAKNGLVEATLTDSKGNTRKTITESQKMSGLLDGIAFKFDSQAAQVSGIGGISSGLRLSTAQNIGLKLGSNTLNVSLSSGDWSIEGLARSINAQIEADPNFSLSGIRASVSDGQISLGYDRSTSAPQPFEITTGSQTLGINAGSYSYSARGNKDSSAIVEGFSTYRNEAASKDISFSINQRTYAAFTTQIDPTKADLANSLEMVSDLNDRLTLAKADVRVDISGDSLVFTSLKVGTDRATNARSVVNLDAVDQFGNKDTATLQQFGFRNTLSYGYGESGFRAQVKDSTPALQIGANEGQTMKVSMGDMSADALGIADIDLTTIHGASASLSKIDRAIDSVTSEVSRLGSYQNRLNFTMNNIENASANMTSAESRIRDADIAAEMIEYTRNQILTQASTAMLAQANSIMGNVLTLLKK
ncbi:MAG: flagellin [Candidatus Riflebacteria bacterium]|nr:flagellin [Candidatus Riflebacteria bacterium]